MRSRPGSPFLVRLPVTLPYGRKEPWDLNRGKTVKNDSKGRQLFFKLSTASGADFMDLPHLTLPGKSITFLMKLSSFGL